MHRLLARQLKRANIDLTELPEQIQQLLVTVEQAYEQNDEDRALVERSLELMSAELVEQNAQLSSRVATLNITLDAIQDAVIVVDRQGNYLAYNQPATHLFGIVAKDPSQQNEVVLLDTLAAQLEIPGDLYAMLHALEDNPLAELTGVLSLKDARYLEYCSRPKIIDSELSGRVWSFREVTELKRKEAQIRFQACHDALTGLPNRQLFVDRLEQALLKKKRSQSFLAVLFLDLDHFKDVNDLLGHESGDKLLCTVSKRITECLREQDTLARFGGDEFVLLLDGINAESEADAIAKRILNALAAPFEELNEQIKISTSIGIAFSPRHAITVDDLIRKADMAMYQAKAAGRNTAASFQPQMEAQALHRLSLESRLRNAVSDNNLELYFQPKIHTKGMRLIGFEALVRWHCPEHGIISPGEFIPLAEESDLILEIGQWVLRQACQQLALWRELGHATIGMAVNLSVKQLYQEDFLAQVQALLDEFHITPGLLELEITESMVIGNIDSTISVLQALRAMGVKVAIDDFGTGYSSLNYLRQLPADTLKIDQSFVAALHDSPSDLEIIKTIISVAHTLNFMVVAEGVEDLHTLSILADANCDEVQGYLLSRPMPAELVENFLQPEHINRLYEALNS
ncbi:EAL domain-containing protein [Corallincola luteus]|uniref:EAL domain-containing protein n=1 Tax=Corallincola luteus TaxID=1775177 RepID=A0ABY2AN75_9GAMM|nr:EAL domain-containing protein [Corallincola luteus]TCI03737.1 EAL domain-containing protein [Corallincola luteus]